MAYVATNTAKTTAAERQIKLALYVRQHGPVTRQQIQQHVAEYAPTSEGGAPSKRCAETTRRMFERDKHALAEQGMVIRADASGCYTIDTHSSTCLPVELTSAEANLLRIACTALIADPSYLLKEELRGALVKLSDELEAPDMLPLWLKSETAIGVQHNVCNMPGTLKKVRAALVNAKCLRFDYVDAFGVASKREVEPIGLLSRDGHWYLASFDPQAAAERTFRLDRMSHVSVSGARDASTPASLYSEQWDRLPFQFGDELVEGCVRFEAEAAARAEALTDSHGTLAAEPDCLIWCIDNCNPEALAAWCISHGPGIVPLSPAEAVDAYCAGVQAAEEAQSSCVAVEHKPARSHTARKRLRPAKSDNLLFALFALIERNGTVSIPQAAQMLGSSEDEVYDALEQLLFAYDSAANIRLELGERGGAVASLAATTHQTLRMTAAETLALMDALESCGVDKTSELCQKLLKTKGALTGHTQLRVVSANDSVNEELLNLLAKRCEAQDGLLTSITYLADGARAAEERLIKPVAIRSQYGHRYVQAWCSKAQAMRDFRLDRILAASVSSQQAPTSTPPRQRTVHSTTTIWLAPGTPNPEWPGQVLAAQADGSSVVHIDWLGSAWLPKQIAALMGDAVVVETGELKDAVVAYAHALRANALSA